MKTLANKTMAILLSLALLLSVGLVAAPAAQAEEYDGPNFTGAWHCPSNWGDVIYVDQYGATVYGTYYWRDGSIKGTFVGTVRNGVMHGTWCQNADGTPEGGMTLSYVSPTELKVTWGRGKEEMQVTDKGTPSTEFSFDRSKMRYRQGTDLGKPDITPQGASANQNKPEPQDNGNIANHKAVQSLLGVHAYNRPAGLQIFQVGVQNGQVVVRHIFKMNDGQVVDNCINARLFKNVGIIVGAENGPVFVLATEKNGMTGYASGTKGAASVSEDTYTQYKHISKNTNLNDSAQNLIKEAMGGLGGNTAIKPEPQKPSPAQPAQEPAKPTGGVQEIAITDGAATGYTKVHVGPTGVTVSLGKSSGAIGYRLYRSESAGSLGESCSDFYITAKSFTDVNVEPNTTYHYTLREVKAEARPTQGKDEEAGRVLAKWTLTTPSNVNEGFTPGQTRHFIVLKINSPLMSVDGKEKEVDPGRGTTPIIYRNRTMLPIRAVVEGMDGKAGWDGGKREIKLAANGQNVNMWVDQTKIQVNGAQKKIDVSPFIRNGRTFTPIRFAAQNLKCKVDWLNSTQEIVIAWSA